MERHAQFGGIVLCGGLSTRMGRPKAWLPFRGELMLPRVVRIVSNVVSPVVVVAARRQDVPPLSAGVDIVCDEYEACGPLAGLAAGLSALSGKCDAAYVTSCDVPFLSPEFIRRIVEFLGENDLAIPRDAEFHYPLAAVYRVHLASRARALIDAGQRRMVSLIQASRSRIIDVADLRAIDPELSSLRNINTPEDYSAALAFREC